MEYPVFFECQTLDTSQKEKIKKYFEIRRKSGGADCGPVQSVGDNVYKIAFIDQKGMQMFRWSDRILSAFFTI